jgi:hypothetical protein
MLAAGAQNQHYSKEMIAFLLEQRGAEGYCWLGML